MWVAISQRKICWHLARGCMVLVATYMKHSGKMSIWKIYDEWTEMSDLQSFFMWAMPWLYAALFLRFYTLMFWVASIFLGTALQSVRNSLRGSWKEMEQLLPIACFIFAGNVSSRYIPRLWVYMSLLSFISLSITGCIFWKCYLVSWASILSSVKWEYYYCS